MNNMLFMSRLQGTKKLYHKAHREVVFQRLSQRQLIAKALSGDELKNRI